MRTDNLVIGVLAILLVAISFAPVSAQSSGPIEIDSADDLSKIEQNLNADFVLTDDISAGSQSPIGSPNDPFTGTLDGQGHTISGLTIDKIDQKYVGLFGYVENAEIGNLHLDSPDITGEQYVGAIVGGGTVSMDTVSVTGGTVYADGNVAGGIIGEIESTDTFVSGVFDSKSTATVEANHKAGGIVGKSIASDIPTQITKIISGGSVEAYGSCGTFCNVDDGAIVGDHSGAGYLEVYWNDNVNNGPIGGGGSSSEIYQLSESEMTGSGALSNMDGLIDFQETNSYPDLYYRSDGVTDLSIDSPTSVVEGNTISIGVDGTVESTIAGISVQIDGQEIDEQYIDTLGVSTDAVSFTTSEPVPSNDFTITVQSQGVTATQDVTVEDRVTGVSYTSNSPIESEQLQLDLTVEVNDDYSGDVTIDPKTSEFETKTVGSTITPPKDTIAVTYDTQIGQAGDYEFEVTAGDKSTSQIVTIGGSELQIDASTVVSSIGTQSERSISDQSYETAFGTQDRFTVENISNRTAQRIEWQIDGETVEIVDSPTFPVNYTTQWSTAGEKTVSAIVESAEDAGGDVATWDVDVYDLALPGTDSQSAAPAETFEVEKTFELADFIGNQITYDVSWNRDAVSLVSGQQNGTTTSGTTKVWEFQVNEGTDGQDIEDVVTIEAEYAGNDQTVEATDTVSLSVPESVGLIPTQDELSDTILRYSWLPVSGLVGYLLQGLVGVVLVSPLWIRVPVVGDRFTGYDQRVRVPVSIVLVGVVAGISVVWAGIAAATVGALTVGYGVIR